MLEPGAQAPDFNLRSHDGEEIALSQYRGKWVVLHAFPLAFTGGWGWSGLLTFAVVRANPDAPAAATGISHMGTYVGAAFGPPLFGVVAEHISFATAWWGGTASLGLAAMLVAWAHLRGGAHRNSERDRRAE